MEIKRSNNFILSRLVPELDKQKAKIQLGYKSGDLGVMIQGKHCDSEMMAMFGIGLAYELYEIAKGHPIFNRAFLEAVKELEKRVVNDIDDK